MSGEKFTFGGEDVGRIANAVRANEQNYGTVKNSGVGRKFRDGEVIASITGTISGSKYTAKEQVWNDTTKLFEDFTGARVWDDVDNIDAINELSGNTSVSIGTIICPFFKGDNANNPQWFFSSTSVSASTPLSITYNSVDDTFDIQLAFTYGTAQFNEANLTSTNDIVLADELFRFNRKAGVDYFVYISIPRFVTNANVTALSTYWRSDESSISFNPITTAREFEFDADYTIVSDLFKVELKSDMTSVINTSFNLNLENNFKYIGAIHERRPSTNFLTYNEGTKTLTAFFSGGNQGNSLIAPNSLVVPNPTSNSNVLLTKDYLDTTWGIELGSTTKDISFHFGNIATDAAGNLLTLFTEERFILPLTGKTENVTISGTTLHFISGTYSGQS